jgi:hypothetical protein
MVNKMKSFKQFLSESVTIQGDFNGNLYMNSSQQEEAKESFVADVVWEGKIYRLEVEGKIMSKNELAEQLQGEYPGAIVHNIYPSTTSSLNIKSAQRYRPESLTWSD